MIVSISPHLKAKQNISRVMLDVIIALLPAVGFSIYFFSINALIVISISILSCVLAEYLFQKIFGLSITISDLSAVLTGLLFALSLPPTTPWWMVAVGAMVAIVLGKGIFGGLGFNPFNPALIGRAFLQVSWPQTMTTYITPYDAITTATPLTNLKLLQLDKIPSYFELLVGNCPGSLGETPKLALLIGALYLLLRRQIKLYTPLSFVISTALVAFVFQNDVLFHILSGGLILGAFYMATDPVTTPLDNKGKIIFGVGCGLLTGLIRIKGGYPEGVCYSILIMNIFTPIIDNITLRKPLGR